MEILGGSTHDVWSEPAQSLKGLWDVNELSSSRIMHWGHTRTKYISAPSRAGSLDWRIGAKRKYRYLVCYVQLDLSIHALGEVPKIHYPDTKVSWLAAACGATCFPNIWITRLQIVHAGLNEPGPTGPLSLHRQLCRFGWIHGMTRQCEIITTTQVTSCARFSCLGFQKTFCGPELR